MSTETVNDVSEVLSEQPLTDAQKKALQENVSKGKDYSALAQLGMPSVLSDEQQEAAKLSAAKCDERIEAIRKFYENADIDVCEAMALCVEHCYRFRDTSKIAKLFTVLPRTFDVAGFRVLIEKSSPILIPAMHWDQKAKGWVPDFGRDGSQKAIRFYPKGSPKIERLKAAHNGQLWDISQLRRDIETSEAFERPAQNRTMKGISAVTIWEKVLKTARTQIDNAFAVGAVRDMDISYGDKVAMDADFVELETMLKQFIRDAKKLHDEAKGDGSRDGTRRLDKDRLLRNGEDITNAPPSGSSQPEPQHHVA